MKAHQSYHAIPPSRVAACGYFVVRYCCMPPRSARFKHHPDTHLHRASISARPNAEFPGGGRTQTHPSTCSIRNIASTCSLEHLTELVYRFAPRHSKICTLRKMEKAIRFFNFMTVSPAAFSINSDTFQHKSTVLMIS